MSTKHIDVNFHDDRGSSRHQKVWFTENHITSANGIRYEIGRYRNKGSNGTLFECKNEKSEILAVKFLHQMDEQRISRFEFESQVLADLDHPNVLKFYDAGSVETTFDRLVPFVITTLFRGTLEGEIERSGRLQEHKVKSISLQLSNALRYIHEAGIIHRDIKPANIFLKDNDVVLGDFGIAKTLTDEGATRFYRSDLTMHSEFVGPVLWLSPELAAYARDKSVVVDHRSDLFQIGLVIWYMLTGEIPRGILDPADDPSGGKYHALVSRLLMQRPERRMKNADELIQAITSL